MLMGDRENYFFNFSRTVFDPSTEILLGKLFFDGGSQARDTTEGEKSIFDFAFQSNIDGARERK
jgi:hypothetical protein